MTESDRWHQLYRTMDQSRVRSVLMSITAMEFDVRCLDRSGRVTRADELDDAEGPFAIQVDREDVADLAEVVEEIVAEQEEFDARLDDRDRKELRARRRLILLMVVIMLVLATLGLIDL